MTEIKDKKCGAVELDSQAHRMLAELSKKRKDENQLVKTRVGIIKEMIQILYKKEISK